MDFLPSCQQLSVAELDRRLERAVEENARSEKLICFYLGEIQRRAGYQAFGFANIYDYALERFGFSPRKTRYLLYLSRKLRQLPQLTEALAKGRIGWTKASQVAAVATPEDEASWVESAVALSSRQLERKIRDGLQPSGGKVSFWLSAEQASVWQRAMEICRRMCGEEIDPGRCLELIAGEFLATYEYLMEQAAEPQEVQSPSEEQASSLPDGPSREPRMELDAALERAGPLSEKPSESSSSPMCPERDLPSPAAIPYTEIHRAVLNRDQYRCQYPGCSAMAGLHVHHLEYRSRSGRKGRERSNSPPNLLVLCFVHHRMVHAGIIGVKGKAPEALEWRRPELMETAMARFESMMADGLEPDDFETEEQENSRPVEPFGNRELELYSGTFAKSDP